MRKISFKYWSYYPYSAEVEIYPGIKKGPYKNGYIGLEVDTDRKRIDYNNLTSWGSTRKRFNQQMKQYNFI